MAGAVEQRQELRSYSRLHVAVADVVTPTCREELKAILRAAAAAARRVTFRSGGYSFDRQALESEPALVVSLAGLTKIGDLDEQHCLLPVEPGVEWGHIMDKLLPGYVPAITITTSHATAGGTLSANALSRFSSAYGKEGRWVVEATIVTPDGKEWVCRPPLPDLPRDQWTQRERLFMGAVGGLGYVGAFVEITYRVLKVPAPAHVRTTVRRFNDLERFSERLRYEAKRAEGERSNPFDPTKRDAIYGAVYTDRKGRRQAMLFTSSYTSERGKRMLIHRPGLRVRPWVERALASRLNRPVWLVGFWMLPMRKAWVDPARDFAFFQDGNVATMKRFPKLKVVQETFVIARPDLTRWLDAAGHHFGRMHVHPTLQDVVALPKDLPFSLSVTPTESAFGVTYSFITADMAKVQAIEAALFALSEIALHEFHGRVSLVKNVFASPEIVREMFGPQVAAFAELRRQFRANGVLVNAFFDDTLGREAGAEGTRPTPGGG